MTLKIPAKILFLSLLCHFSSDSDASPRPTSDISTSTCYTCHEYFLAGHRKNGVYQIRVLDDSNLVQTVSAVCDLSSSSMYGYTYIQQRVDGSVSFVKSYDEYRQPFGEIDSKGNFLLGLDNIHFLTTNCNQSSVRFDLFACNGSIASEDYSTFKVDGGSRNYTLHVGGASGPAGDGLCPGPNLDYLCMDGVAFSTVDRDNDPRPTINCAQHSGQGGWWYSDDCGFTILNGGDYHPGCPVSLISRGLIWYGWPKKLTGHGWQKGHGPRIQTIPELAGASMKLRPVD